MKKSILNLGESLKKEEQKQINGGYGGSECLSLGALCHTQVSIPCCNSSCITAGWWTNWGTCGYYP